MTEAGQLVGDYQVLAQLGTGGMGRVYKVRNVISNREEAMKILLPDFASDKELAARFMAEIRTLATLEHPGIAQLRTAFQANNQFVMVMEYVEGTTLEKLAAAVRIPLDKVLDYSGQVLEALSYAHSRGVIHRDIKPANVMITTHGLVKLMDFGIAKSTEDMQLTRPGTTMGSVYYMSPEQVRGAAIDARSDLYSFGVTLYEMLTGRKPFQADTSYSVLNAQLNQAPTPPVEVNPAIPAALNAIVLKAMAKQPEERFQTAAELRDALRLLRAGQIPSAASPAAPSPQPAHPSSATWMEPPSPPAASQQASSGFATGAAPTAGAPPAWAPVPPPAPAAPLAGNPRSHRGLWIVLGAVTAILALVAVATVLPRLMSKSRQTVAAGGVAATPQAPAPQPDLPSATTQSPSEAAPEPASGPVVSSAASQEAHPLAAPNAHPARQPYQPATSGSTRPASTAASPALPATSQAAPPPSAPTGPSQAEMQQAQDRLSNLQARADAAISGMEQMRSQQQASGLDMRGDIVAASNRLKNDLREAERALARQDLENANTYLQRGENETATLEKFLGR